MRTRMVNLWTSAVSPYPTCFVEQLANPGRMKFSVRVVEWPSITSWQYFRLCSSFSSSVRAFLISAIT